MSLNLQLATSRGVAFLIGGFKVMSQEILKIKIQTLINIVKSTSLKKPEAISTLYAFWNNRLIENLEITTQLLKQGFITGVLISVRSLKIQILPMQWIF
ncbi:hypothetical protein ACFQ1Q_02815 [Winogradskyella litorisediminis]|uniref:Uncharacterized protein n=1 Tax=Winogradskyella litorisediminis TaxID=1156618 RepID=A0ABW3N6T5_9FLAO